jgi:NDP-sugar pyrophosphorylase family protein
MQAIILSGGRGARLSPFTNSCPKGMLRIEDKPILEYQVEWLVKHGVNKVIFACGYLSQVIQNYFMDGKRYGIKAEYSIEDEPLGRGGAVKNALKNFPTNERLIVTNGDICTGMDLRLTVDAHIEQNLKKGILATLSLFPYKSPYGIVRLNEDSYIVGFDEKRALPYWVNGGIYVFEPTIIDYLPDKGDHEVTTFPELAKKSLIYGYKSMDFWKGIDTIKDLNEFSAEYKNLESVK